MEDFSTDLSDGVLLCAREVTICLSFIHFLEHSPANMDFYFFLTQSLMFKFQTKLPNSSFQK